MRRICLVCAVSLLAAVQSLHAQTDIMGVNALRAYDPTLTGSGIAIAQPEAIFTGSDGFEVNPSIVGQPSAKFIYTGTDGTTATGYPNTVGHESQHADAVADNIYGENNTSDPEGIAYGVSTVYNYDANYFFNTDIYNNISTPAKIVNQSFIFLSGTDTTTQAEIQQIYDNYAAQHGTLFLNGAGDSAPILAPASAYNCIGVGAYQGTSASGTTYDGRSKVEIVAPGGATSYATGYVSGAAAVLLQAAQRGDAGSGTASAASDARVLKALLLNGAVKPTGWTHTATEPLDPTYGSGILNVDNSYMNLRGGKYGASSTTSGTASANGSGAAISSLEGWNFTTITNTGSNNNYTPADAHYLFNLSSTAGSEFTLTSTLVWWKQYNASTINNLDLYLFNVSTGASIAISDSPVDNVQQLYVQDLAPGEYDLVVTKAGGGVVSQNETYALAFNFAAVGAPQSVPEPGGVALGAMGLVSLGMLARYRRRG
jgi:hypothetical protein